MNVANKNSAMPATSNASSEIAISDILTLSIAEISERMKRESENSTHERYVFKLTKEGTKLNAAQQDVVDYKLREAMTIFKKSTSSSPVNADALSSRLGKLAIDEDGSARLGNNQSDISIRSGRHDQLISSSLSNGAINNYEEDFSQRSNATTVGTTTPSEEEAVRRVEVKLEAKYNELREMGGRPVCSLEDLQKWISDPDTSTLKGAEIAAWLPQSVESLSTGNDRATIIENLDVYSEQTRHWWGFLRYQASHRGIPSDDIEPAGSVFRPFTRYVELKTRSYDHLINVHASHDARKIQELKHTWNHLPDPQTVRVPVPDGTNSKKAVNAPAATTNTIIPTEIPTEDTQLLSFDGYCQDIKKRLAPYYFRRSPALHIEPSQQNHLTTWLEYLCFELAYLEPFTKARADLAPQYNQAWVMLKRAAGKLSTTNVAIGSIAGSLAQNNSVGSTTSAGQEAIRNFLKQTAPYRHLDAVVQRLQARIQWIESEARAMEAKVEAEAKAEPPTEPHAWTASGERIDRETSEGFIIVDKSDAEATPDNVGGNILSLFRHAYLCLVNSINS